MVRFLAGHELVISESNFSDLQSSSSHKKCSNKYISVHGIVFSGYYIPAAQLVPDVNLKEHSQSKTESQRIMTSIDKPKEKKDNGTASSTLFKGTGVVGILTLLSRVLGLVRDLLVARFLGAGLYTDAFFVAFRVPNLMRSLVAEGALTSAFVPVFSHELEHNPTHVSSILSSAAKFLTLLTLGLAILGVFTAPWIVSTLAPGFSVAPTQKALCVSLTAIMSFYLVFVALVSLANGALNSMRVYGAAPMGQVVMNLALIAGAILAAFFSEHTAVYILAWSVILGGVASLLIQLPLLRKAGLSLSLAEPAFTPTTKQMLKLMVPATAGAAVYQVSIFMNTVLASLLPIGSVSWLFYADRLAQLPIGLFTIALASVLLPALSKSSATNNTQEFGQSLFVSLSATSFVMIPTSFALYVLAPDLVSVLFLRGAFSLQSAQATAQAVQAMCIGLWAMSCSSMCMRAFIATRDTITPTLFGIGNVVIGITVSVWLIGTPIPLENSSMHSLVSAYRGFLLQYLPDYQLQHVGLALSTGISSLVTLPVVFYLLLKRGVHLPCSKFLVHTGKCIMCSLIMMFIMLEIGGIQIPAIARLILSVTAGTSAYLCAGTFLGLGESEVLAKTVVKLLRRYAIRNTKG
jgi:putative peptidoglycan lipid II flippase